MELQSRQADGEFWLDETEFMTQFDDVTVGYPSSDEGHLKSIFTGECIFGQWLMLVATPESDGCPDCYSNRKITNAQTPVGWLVDKWTLRGWQSEQQQLRQQPEVLAESVQQRRGCGVFVST